MNMKKLLLFVAVAAFMSACVKHQEPIRFSVLGDSYSSLEGSVYPDTNDVYHFADIGVTEVEQMWWSQVAASTGWLLDRNNSFSGAMICNYDLMDYYVPASFIHRMDNLGRPDVIFILGGVNDVWYGAPFGDFVYSGWIEEQLRSYRPALAYMFDKLKRLYPCSKLYFVLETDPCPGAIDEEIRMEYIISTHRVANHYDVDCIDLVDVHKNLWHPDVEGQKNIADQVLEYLAIENP